MPIHKFTLEDWQRAAPLCNKHLPSTGGVRAQCLICGLEEMSRALSRIDYLLDGVTNEFEVSGYDVHCDPDAVVRRVADLMGVSA